MTPNLSDFSLLRTRTAHPIKCEILFTRKCNTLCGYCGITEATVGKKFDLGVADWLVGLRQLAKLKVPMLCIYGGEPTLRLHDLCLFVKAARSMGIQTTVISDCIDTTPDTWELLAQNGLTSVTVSLDHPPDHASVQEKGRFLRSSAVLKTLGLFLDTDAFPDVEVVMTVGRDNLHEVVAMHDWCAQHGFWIHYDLQHPDRGQPGSKCSGSAYPFREADMPQIREQFQKVLERKLAGAKIHTSADVLQRWLHPDGPVYLNWKCSAPWWLSVDCDGSMMACDDLAISPVSQVKITQLADRWDEFLDLWKAWRQSSGCRCFWATHVSAREQALSPTGAADIAHGRTH